MPVLGGGPTGPWPGAPRFEGGPALPRIKKNLLAILMFVCIFSFFTHIDFQLVVA